MSTTDRELKLLAENNMLDARENQTGDLNVAAYGPKADPAVRYLHLSRKMEGYLDTVDSPDKPDMLRLLALMGESVITILAAPGDPVDAVIQAMEGGKS